MALIFANIRDLLSVCVKSFVHLDEGVYLQLPSFG